MMIPNEIEQNIGVLRSSPVWLTDSRSTYKVPVLKMGLLQTAMFSKVKAIALLLVGTACVTSAVGNHNHSIPSWTHDCVRTGNRRESLACLNRRANCPHNYPTVSILGRCDYDRRLDVSIMP